MSMMYDIDGAAELIMAEMASERIFEEIQNILENLDVEKMLRKQS